MTVAELFRCLVDRHVELYLDGDRLRFRAPVGALTSDLRAEISAQRSAIIDHLRTAKATNVIGTRCTICDWKNWVDAPPENGRIRTTCRKCGRFIGYRPAGSPRG